MLKDCARRLGQKLTGAGRLSTPVALLCLGISGCGLDSHMPIPQFEVPDSWKESTKKAALKPKWPAEFAVFKSTRLTQLIAMARAQNLDVGAAIARVHQAEAGVGIALQPLIPTIQAEGDASRSFSHMQGFAQKTNLFTAQLTASYVLDFWGKNQAAFHSAEAAAIQANFDAITLGISTDAMVAGTYFNAIGTQKQIEIAKRNLGIAEHTLEAIRARNKAGTASGLDVAQQETLTNNVRVTIPPLELALAQYKHALAVLVGEAPEFYLHKGEDLFAVTVPRLQPGLPSELLCRRPDVASAEAQLAEANFDVISARAAMFPTIQLTGNGGFENAALSTLFQPQHTFYTMAASAIQPLTNEVGLQATLDQKKSRYDELHNDYRKAIISAFRDVDNALIAYRKDYEQEQLQEMAVVSARRAYEISQAQLKSGIIDITTLLTIQQTLFTAENALVTVRIARLQAAVTLYQVLGGGWQKTGDVSIAQINSLVTVRAKSP